MSQRRPIRLRVLMFGIALAVASSASAQPPAPPPAPPERPHRADRGPGVATSMFGTYIRGGELLLYPFFEHYRDRNFEYKPSEFGFAGDVDHRGRYRASEALLFLAYGLTDDLAIEVEGAAIRASLDKAAADTSATPARIAESGLGDIEGQLRWRWKREDQLVLIRDLEVARVQGERWRSEARTLLTGLGEAIDAQFTRWNLTDAEREVALLLLKGLSLKEVAAVRAATERTIRAQAQAIYAKAGVSGRASLSAFFLEDLLAPMTGESDKT